MVTLSIWLYWKLLGSGLLLEGTWKSTDSEIKTDGKTAEIFSGGAAESAVLNILSYDDNMLSGGRVVYHCELCFEHRAQSVTIIYENHSGVKLMEVVIDGKSEIFLFE